MKFDDVIDQERNNLTSLSIDFGFCSGASECENKKVYLLHLYIHTLYNKTFLNDQLKNRYFPENPNSGSLEIAVIS